jgi:transcriptional regulator with GAF, ATPase, and Fis domain
MTAQAKLRVLQEREVDWVEASLFLWMSGLLPPEQDLKEEIQRHFRQSLFFRLNVVTWDAVP